MEGDSFVINHVMLFGKNPGKGTISDTLERMGIKLLKSAPSNVNPVVCTVGSDRNRHIYVGSFSAYIVAALTRDRVPLGHDYYEFSMTDVCPRIPLTPPPTAFSFKYDLSEEKKIFLAGHGAKWVGNMKHYVVPKMDQTLYKKLIELGVEDRTRGKQIYNLTFFEDIRTLGWLKNVISAALFTNVYSSQDTLHTKTTIKNLLRARTQQSLKRRKTSETTEIQIGLGDQSSDTMEIDTGEVSPRDAYDEIVKIYRFAKPSIETTRTLIAMDEARSKFGLWCPFIVDLAKPDLKQVLSFVTDYLHPFTGETVQSRQDFLKTLKGVTRRLCSTTMGHELAHITKCLDIGLRSSSIVYCVCEEMTYKGCIINGQFVLALSNEYYGPSEEQLGDLLVSCDKHSQTISAIARICGKDLSHIKSVRELHYALAATPLQLDQIEDIKVHATHLNYREQFWKHNSDNVFVAYSNIMNNLEFTDLSIPMHPSAILDPRVEMNVLSAFGSTAPSLVMSGAPRIVIRGNNLPKDWLFCSLELSQSCDDIAMMKTRKIFQNITPNRSSAKYIYKGLGQQLTLQLNQLILRTLDIQVTTMRIAVSEENRTDKSYKDDVSGFFS